MVPARTSRKASVVVISLLWAFMVLLLWPATSRAEEDALGSARLQISGTRLALDPVSQTVPLSTPTIVGTELQGYDPARGTLPPDLVVLGDFSGPEVEGVLVLETVPNEPFRIPRLRLEGEYVLDNVRLVQGEEILAYAEPGSARVNVTQILVTRVSSRAMTAEEIRSYGLALDADNFQAYNLTFGFGVSGEEISYDLPLVYNIYGPDVDWALGPENFGLPQFDEARRTLRPRFRPPRLTPFRMRLPRPERRTVPEGGCDIQNSECRDAAPESFPMVGVLLFPTELSLLHQFFSVALMVQNGAPDGDPATIEDLVARIQLPSALRLAETDPPGLVGAPVHVVDPGADGELGTPDDLSALAAQATGEARYVVEGRNEGTHVVHFDLSGTLLGLPSGPQPITGSARGAVAVRDPSLAVQVTHPQVVRADIEYWLDFAVTNLGTAPVNQISISFPSYALSGVAIVGEAVKTIATLEPGDSATVEFRVRPSRTGKIIASSVQTGSSLQPSFAYSLEVGGSGSLSPDSLVLPEEAQGLPRSLVRPALALAGLGHSLAQSPPSLGSGLPRVSGATVDERIYRLKQTGIHHDLGEDLFDAVALLAMSWSGAEDGDWDWDALVRESQSGGEMEDAFASLLDSESPSARDAFDRLAATAHHLGPQAVMAAGAGLEVSSRTSGKAISGPGLDPARVRELPFAQLYGLTGAELVTLTAPEDGGYRVRLSAAGGAAELHLLLPDAAGDLAAVRFTTLSLAAGAEAVLDFEPGQSVFNLDVDDDGDGVTDRAVAPDAIETVAPRPFGIVTARVAADDPSAHVVEVLFSEDVDLESLHPADPGHFVVAGKTSNGGLVEAERDLLESALLGGETIENPFEGLRNPRLVRVVFDNPLSPLADNDMTVSGLTGISGQALPTQTVEVLPSPYSEPGAMVEGVVFGPDGLPVANATVVLYQSDKVGTRADVFCRSHPTAKVTTDAAGFYRFDYVRRTACSSVFKIRAQDPVTSAFGTTSSRVSQTDTTYEVDIVMPRRGKLRGRVTYADGTVPQAIRVVASNRDFNQGRLAHVDADGFYDVDHMIVGTVTLAADDGAGNFVFRTVELPSGDVTVEQDLVIIPRRRDEPSPGSVRGRVIDEDGAAVFDAQVALYVDGRLIGVETSDGEGGFDFGLVPAGIAEIEAFDEASILRGKSAARLFFEVEPDELSDVEVRLLTVSGSIEGHVYRKRWNGELTALAGAVVWIEGTPFNTVTDSAGYYRFDDIFAGDWRLAAALADTGEKERGTVSITSATESGGVPSVHDFYFQEKLERGGIVGRVYNFTDQPVSGATIRLAGGYGSVRWHHQTTTDEGGYFAIEDLGAGTYGVHAIKGSNGGLGWAEVLYPGHTATIDVRFRRGTVRVTTVALQGDGSEVPVSSQLYYRSVEVTEHGVVAVASEYSVAQTDPADGSFEFETLVGPYDVIVYNPFHQTLSLDGHTGRARGELVFDGEVREHKVVFEENGTIRGVVYEHDEETPSAGTVVTLNGGGFSDFDVTTDEYGYFEFRLVPRGSYRLKAVAEDGAIFRQAEVKVRMAKAGDAVDAEIVLPEQGSVAGVVETQDGDPVPGAVVKLSEGSYPWRRIVQNADEEGFFAFNNIFAGTVVVDAQAPSLGGLAGRKSAEIAFEGEEVSTIVTLEATGEIAGTVFDPDSGLPVANARVSLYSGTEGIMETVSSDADGQYRFRLLPVRLTYQVRVFDPLSGRRGRSAWIGLAEHNEVAQADTVLEVRGEVQGHFYDDDTGATVPANTVRLKIFGRFTAYGTTDENGLFEFGGIPEGDFYLYAREPEGRRHASSAGTLVEEDEVVVRDLHLVPTSFVFGKVLNPIGSADENGLFPNANTRVVQNGVIGAGFDNPYSFDGVLPRRPFTVIAVENGGIRESRASGKISELGSDAEIDLRMPAVGSVTVEVFAADGVTPATGVNVTVGNRHATGKESFYGGTGAGNSVTFGDVREGQLWARAKDPVDNLRGSATGTLSTEDESVTLSVSLEATGTLRGQAVLPDGVTPAAFASVAVERGGGWLFAEADEDGLFTVDPVRMGGYTLIVQEADGGAFAERRGTLTENLEVHDLGVVRLDEENPRVVSISPANGSMNLPLTVPIVITFSEPMDTTRGQSSLELRKSGGGKITVQRAWSADGTSVTVTPSSGTLASGTAYDMTVKQAIYDVAGRPMSWAVRSSFQTADVVPPAPIDVQPADGAVEVPVESSIEVLFSEPVDPASLSGSAFQLVDTTSGEGVTTTVQLRPGDREVILTPQIMPGIGRLQEMYPDRLMQLVIQGVSDPAGNVMPAPVTTSFWTPDETLPELAWLTPAAGEAFTAGDTVPIAVDATDNRGVARVDFTIGEWSSSDSQSPYGWNIAAPVVDVVSDVEITAVVTDVFGNQQSFARTISVAPRNNASPPAIVSACPLDGDLVAPGLEIPIPYAITDDESIESFWLEVDGVRLEVKTPYDQPAADGTYKWTPPAGAVAEQVFDVRLRARDFAGNVGEHVLALAVPAGLILAGDQTVDASTLTGQSVAMAAGEITVDGVLDLTDLALLWNAKLTSASTLLDLRVSGRTHVQCGGEINLSGLGYLGGWVDHPQGYGPEGIAQSDPNSGASHGGFGQQDPGSAVGEVYGSVRWPLQAGAGGSNALRTSANNTLSAGGGVFAFDVNELIVDGIVRARGRTQGRQGAGAGGSGLVVADSLRGIGTIDVNGGPRGSDLQANPVYPAGGGGRLALHVLDLSGFDVRTQASSNGGFKKAGPGTVFVHTSGSTFGTLYLDAGFDDTSEVPAVELPALGGGTVTATEVTGGGLDLWVGVDVTLRERWQGAHMELFDAADASLGTYSVAEIDTVAGRARLAAAAAVVAPVRFEGRYLFDEIVFGRGASLVASDPVIGTDVVIEEEFEVDGELVAENLTLASGARVRPLTGGTLRLEVSGRMEVGAGAVIEVNGLGYHGGWQGHPDGYGPDGVTTSAPISGASHGGLGQQNGGSTVGETYGSVAWPKLGGGGGGNGTRATPDNTNSAGGGVLILEVGGELVLDGELQAKGVTAGAQGAGAGGTIFIDAGKLSGAGRIVAEGGPRGKDSFANPVYFAGGGGRVALHVDDLSVFDVAGQVEAHGGYEKAGPGTIYVRGAGAEVGDLVIAAQPGIDDVSVVPATALPALGGGAVVAADAARSPGDLWLTADVALLDRWHGAWMELFDGAGQSLGRFEVTDRDAVTGEVRLADAGGVTGAATFAGLHRFGQVTTLNGASLTAADPVVAGEVVLTDETAVPAYVEAETVRLAAGAVVRPASGMEMRISAGTLIVEAGAVLDASGYGHAGGHAGHPEGYAPEGVTPSSPDAGGSHGGMGRTLAGAGPAGEVYGSVYHPAHAGGGGALTIATGTGTNLPGGGVIDVVAGAVVLEGEIRADGLGGVGPGAGGSVAIVATTMSGGGLIEASGGNSNSSCFGATSHGLGGGGRVALHVATFNGFDPAAQVRAAGGGKRGCSGSTGPFAGPGTVLVKTAASTYGDLRIVLDDPAAVTVGDTPLPAIEYGTVGQVSAAGADLWIEPADPAAVFGVGVTGMWVRSGGVDYPVIGERADRRAVRLEGAAGAVAAGDDYLGVYKFDNVIVAGGAHLLLRDHSEVESWTVDEDSSVTTLDVLAPVFDSVTPAEGAVYSSGDTIDVAAQVSDDNGVVEVVFELDGQVYRDTAEPWTWSVRAPGVAAATDVVLTLEAFDAEGSSSTFARTLHVDPIAAGDPPALGFACPSVVSQHVPGGAFDVVVAAVDPSGVGIDRVEIYLDGAAVPDAVLFQEPFTYTWTAPASAVEGDNLTLRAVARSYGAQSSEITIQVPVVERPLLADGSVLDATLNGQEIFLDAGVHTLAEPVDLASLTVLSGATLAGSGNAARLTASGTLTVHCGAAIDVSGLGFSGGANGAAEAPDGLSASAKHAGGSHGGLGAFTSGPSGEAFDSVVAPSLGGGGGGDYNGSNFGGDGGGVLSITAGSLILGGELRARGLDYDLGGTNVGAGAGGSVTIVAGSMSGGGRIDASGGDQRVVPWTTDDGNPGGGGRVALDVDVFAGFDPETQVLARGGTRFETDGETPNGYAGPGTVYVFTTGSTYGDLYVDQGATSDVPVAATPLPTIGTGFVGTATAEVSAPADAWIEPADPARQNSLGVFGMWVRTGGADYPVTGESADRRGLLLAGAGDALTAETLAVGDAYRGLYKFDRVAVRGGAHLASADFIEVGAWEVDADSTVDTPDQEAPAVTILAPPAASLFVAGDPITIQAAATDNVAVTEVRFDFAGETYVDVEPPWEWTVRAPRVASSLELALSIEAIDAEANSGVASRTLSVDPAPPGTAPAVAFACPGPGALAAPGTGFEVSLAAVDDHAVEKVELYIGGVLAETLETAPYAGRADVPSSALDGEALELRAVVYDFAGQTGDATLIVGVVEGVVFAGDATLAAGDATSDGQSVIVAGGTLTIEGTHTFRDLVVLDGATGTHPPTTAGELHALDLTLDRDLYVACGGALEADGRGYGAGVGYPNTPDEGAADSIGGSHGGRGGHFDAGTAGGVYGSLFDPFDPGAGGGGAGATAGGGVIRVAAAGDVTVDGRVSVRGGEESGSVARGAGGSILLAGTALSGRGTVDASGGGDPGATACGGGGRIALYGATVDADLLSRVTAAGGACPTAAASGSAGTLFIQRDADPLGELVVDNGAVTSLQATPLPVLESGVIDAVQADGFTDGEADFVHSLAGVEVAVNGNRAELWTILGHEHHGQTLILDVAPAPFTAQAGDTYEGLYRFDRVTLAGGVTLEIQDTHEVGEWVIGGDSGTVVVDSDVDPPRITSVTPSAGALFQSGDPIAFSVGAADPAGVAEVRFSFGGQTFTDTSAPWEWTTNAPGVAAVTATDLVVEALDGRGLRGEETYAYTVEPGSGTQLPQVGIVCPGPQAKLAPGTGLDVHVQASDASGIDRVELYVDDETTPSATDTAAPYVLRLVAPAGALDGQAVSYRVVAHNDGGLTSQTASQIGIVQGTVITADTALAAGNASLDGGSVIVAAGTLTVDGPHGFRDLVVLDGATVTHSPAAGASAERLDLTVDRDVYVACGGSVDVAGRGLGGGISLPGPPPAGGRVLYAEDFTASGPSSWEVVDHGSPSNWTLTTDTLYLTQTVNVSTYVLRPEGYPWTDYRFRAAIRSSDDDWIGLMLRYQDDDNYYRFLWDRQGSSRRLEKRVNGAFTVLAEDSVQYAKNVWYQVEIAASGSQLDLSIDGEPVFSVNDGAFAAGTVGLYSGANLGSLFDDVEVVEMSYREDFGDSLLGEWLVVDEGDTDGPSNWTFRNRLDDPYLAQTSNIFSSGSGPRRGTYVVRPEGLGWTDYRFAVKLRAGDDDGIGLMFRYQDAGNYYRFDWDRQRALRRLERVQNGVPVTLAEDSVPYDLNTWYEVEVSAEGDQLALAIDGAPVFAVADATFAAGSVGLFSWNNTDSRFDDIEIVRAPIGAVGGSHGGRGGGFDGTGEVYGSVFDPHDAGAGGRGGTRFTGSAGGGVVRVAAGGEVVVDGRIDAGGEDVAPTAGTSFGAGGSVRLDGAEIAGLGTVDASGAGDGAAAGCGSGGRVALYAATVSDDLLARVSVRGGACATAAASGAAGTLFVRRDSDVYGELVIDNGAVASSQLTELPSVGTGTVASVAGGGIYDPGAEFVHSLAGVGVAFGGDLGQLWTVTDHLHRGPSLGLDTAFVPLAAQAGDVYEGVYRFDRVTVAGGARALAVDTLSSTSAPTVEAGSSLTAGYRLELTVLEPAVGATVGSQETLTVRAAVDDPLAVGIAETALTFDGATSAGTPDTAGTFTWTVTTPIVSQTTVMSLDVAVRDSGGHLFTTTRTVTVQASSDSVPPILVAPDCPADQDLAVAGATLAFPITASDDESIASYSLLVDGQVADTRTGVDLGSIADTLYWTVPAADPPGTIYLVTLEVRDFGGNVTADSRQLVAAGGTVLSGDQSLDSSLDGSILVLGPGTFTILEPLSLASLSLAHGARVTAEPQETLDLTVTGAVDLSCDTSIDVTGLGFPSHQTYPGATVPGTASGGSHLGVGGRYLTNAAGSTFGSVYRPREPGGGSESTNADWGRAGGGAVRIVAGDVNLDPGSVIRANGDGYEAGDNDYARGGGGGSVWITASGTVSGEGTIEARGGVSGPNARGSGGGGAVAVEYAAAAGTVLGGLRAWGGDNVPVGGAGTVYLLGPASTYGDLVLDNGAAAGGETLLPSLGVGTAQAGSGSGVLVTDLVSIPAYFAGHWVEVYDATSGALKGTWRVAGLAGATLTLEPGAGGPAPIAPGDLWQGVYRFDNLTLTGDLRLESEDPVRVAGTQEISGTVELREIRADDLVLRSGSVLAHPPTTDPAAIESLSIELTGVLTLETGAVIDVSGLGFEGDETYPGATTPGTASGGSHIGVGGQYLTKAVGSTFGSVYRPREPGGGTESTHPAWSRAGGGVVRIDAADVNLAAGSAIRANGGGYQAGDDGYARGGGGGSVWITVSGTIAGDGTIEAWGGISGPNDRGSGGGGAIAVRYAASSGSVLDNLQAGGGASTAVGGAGSVYLFGPASTYGDLVLDSGTVVGGTTHLPSLGVGTAQTGSGGDVLVTDLGAVPAYFEGHWVEVYDGSDGALKGTWRVAAASGATLTLEPGGGGPVSVSPDDVWQGVYRFDNVLLAGDHRLESDDPVRVAATQEIAGTVELREISAGDLVLRSGAGLYHPPTTDPAAFESLSIDLTGDLTIEAGAEIDVTGLGFERHETYPGATVPGTASGGSHLGVGGQYLTNAVGSTFGSVYRPREPGGGTHSTDVNWGRSGGGVVRVSAAGVTLAAGSAIRANGDGYEIGDDGFARGGAGGSVWIAASGAIGGDGTIEARGGISGPNERGSGGGGAIAVEYAASSGTVLDNLLAWGGQSPVIGGAGMIYLAGPASVRGDLIVDNGGLAGQGADLPALGAGTAVAGTAGALLVTDRATDIPPFFVGHWVEVSAADSTPKGTYRIASVTGVSATLESETGDPISLVPGDLWRGVYLFDTVTVTGGASLSSADPVFESGVELDLGGN